jgi:2',3'-cyclic-nucleotide 2'-phosphodiesterase (5'-nucleotidase family)
MKPLSILTTVLLLLSSIYAQENKGINNSWPDFNRGDSKNYPKTSWNTIVGLSSIDIISSDIRESSMNNLVCDAILERTDTDFSFLNFGDIITNLYKGEITNLDLFSLCPYGRTLVILEIEGDLLRRLIEENISGIRKGLAIGGGTVEYDTKRPSRNRLTYFQVGDHPLYPKKEYRVVTTDYLADGNAGFEMLTGIDSSKVFRTGILLRDTIRDYIQKYSPLNPARIKLDQRWQKK